MGTTSPIQAMELESSHAGSQIGLGGRFAGRRFDVRWHPHRHCPGEVPAGGHLYPIKEFRGDMRLSFARCPKANVKMYSILVKNRAEEVQKLAAHQQADLYAISGALAQMRAHP